jgi:membrane associated rhomboid family serine protease
MSYGSRSPVNRNLPSNRFPLGVKWLLISNIVIFVAAVLLKPFLDDQDRYLWLIPSMVVKTYAIWQPFTYLFIHSGFGHILWNMLALWMFGTEIERLWGTPRFLRFYFTCGVGAGLVCIIAAYLFGNPNTPTVGSSGAIYGILMAYALLFPDRLILFSFLIPIKVKYFVMIIGGITFLQSYLAAVGMPGGGGGVAVFAHLSGMVIGYLLLRGRRLKVSIQQPLESSYKDWKLQRAKRKFQVYLKKQGSDKDRWVH